MHTLADNPSKTIAIFINDFDKDYVEALRKLSETLGRTIRGVTLIDSKLYSAKRNEPDTAHIFEEIVCDFSNDAALRATIQTLEDNLLLVTASFDQNQPYLKKLLPHIAYLNGPTETSLVWSTQKQKMREILTSYAPELVPDVQAIADDSEESVARILSHLQFPMIVKPTGLGSSALVNKVGDEHELRDILRYTLRVIDEFYVAESGRGKPAIIVENFIVGDMYSIDMYTNQTGEMWCLPPIHRITPDSLGMEGFYPYQIETLLPIDSATVQAGQLAAKKAAKALGLRSCSAHVELLLTTTGWKIVELAPRIGGYRQFMYGAAYGIDHIYNEFLIKVGLEPVIVNEPISYCIVTNTYAEKEGVIVSIDGVDESRAISSVVKMEVHAKAGDVTKSSGKGGRLIVEGYLTNVDPEQLSRDAALARGCIVIRTEPAGQPLASSI